MTIMMMRVGIYNDKDSVDYYVHIVDDNDGGDFDDIDVAGDNNNVNYNKVFDDNDVDDNNDVDNNDIVSLNIIMELTMLSIMN